YRQGDGGWICHKFGIPTGVIFFLVIDIPANEALPQVAIGKPFQFDVPTIRHQRQRYVERRRVFRRAAALIGRDQSLSRAVVDRLRAYSQADFLIQLDRWTGGVFEARDDLGDGHVVTSALLRATIRCTAMLPSCDSMPSTITIVLTPISSPTALRSSLMFSIEPPTVFASRRSPG